MRVFLFPYNFHIFVIMRDIEKVMWDYFDLSFSIDSFNWMAIYTEKFYARHLFRFNISLIFDSVIMYFIFLWINQEFFHLKSCVMFKPFYKNRFPQISKKRC